MVAVAVVATAAAPAKYINLLKYNLCLFIDVSATTVAFFKTIFYFCLLLGAGVVYSLS